MEGIRSYFGSAEILTTPEKDSVQFRVNSLQGLIKVVEHFNKYPLITKKAADYKLFETVVLMMVRKEHLTIQGLQKIINMRATLN